MKDHVLPCNWQITLPDNWQSEYDVENGQCVFYPDNSELTVRITPFHAEREGLLAPIHVMETAYTNTIPESALPVNPNPFDFDGLSSKIYEDTIVENNQMIFVIYIGLYTAGELLSVNIFSKSKTECAQTLDILKTINR